jgi:NAD(P)-dependent dehydrogenase (short-subunit alcohol dehydrogenase family)
MANYAFDFTGQTVFISGASRGIGAATARLFARSGARVVVNYRED